MPKHKLVGRVEIPAENLAQMRARKLDGDRWAVAQNMAMDSARFGLIQYFAIGPTRTFKERPAQVPDTAIDLGWKYRWVGWVDLDKGVVVEE